MAADIFGICCEALSAYRQSPRVAGRYCLAGGKDMCGRVVHSSVI